MAKQLIDAKAKGIILIIALALMFIPIPLIQGQTIGQIAVLGVAILLLIGK